MPHLTFDDVLVTSRMRGPLERWGDLIRPELARVAHRVRLTGLA